MQTTDIVLYINDANLNYQSRHQEGK